MPLQYIDLLNLAFTQGRLKESCGYWVGRLRLIGNVLIDPEIQVPESGKIYLFSLLPSSQLRSYDQRVLNSIEPPTNDRQGEVTIILYKSWKAGNNAIIEKLVRHGQIPIKRILKQSQETPRQKELSENIAQRLHDYRSNEIRQVTPESVEKWADQFQYQDDHEKTILLTEIDRLLARYYFSRAKTKECLRDFLRKQANGSKASHGTLRELNFLQIQKYGISQVQMIGLVDEILQEDFNLSVQNCGGSSVFVYLDDCLFSGNRLLNDFAEWMEQSAREKDTFLIYYVAIHTCGWSHAINKMNELARKAGVYVDYDPPACKLVNARNSNSPVEFFWPQDGHKDHAIQKYIQSIQSHRIARGFQQDGLMRPATYPRKEKVFSSPEARNLVERLFLKAGVDILSSIEKREDARPLGFDKLDTLGFGSLFISYRNISNNCPTAIWFDGSRFSSSWIPLIKRRPNFSDRWWS